MSQIIPSVTIVAPVAEAGRRRKEERKEGIIYKRMIIRLVSEFSSATKMKTLEEVFNLLRESFHLIYMREGLFEEIGTCNYRVVSLKFAGQDNRL